MNRKIVIGPINKGLRLDRTPFVIDNDSFPVLINAYQWRGRVKRKRGTSFLTHFAVFFNSTNISYNTGSSTITLNGSGAGNILTGFTTLPTNATLVPSSVTINGFFFTYTDDGKGNLSNGIINLGSINYATGSIVIAGEAGRAETATFSFYPNLPVMGIEDLVVPSQSFTGTLGFDTTYSYNVQTASPNLSYNVNFFKNPSSLSYPGYTQKTNWTPFKWNGQNYQQFWSTNYQGAFWVTNGIDVSFTGATIGMQFAGGGSGSTITYIGNTATTITFNINTSPLVIGDFVFFNEFSPNPINFQTGYVTAIAGTQYTFTLPDATLTITPYTPGIIQYLTTNVFPTKDCIRFYDGDPTNAMPLNPSFRTNFGWVNFMPPISEAAFSIADLPPLQYYLVGCRMIFPFKDTLLFIGPVVQSSTGSPIYIQDGVVYSQNGTPYYTASFTNTPQITSVTTVFTPILVPTNQVATPTAYFADSTGFGGFVQVGIDEMINSASLNEDVLILGMDFHQIRMVYTGSNIIPFTFFIINSELGTSSTFSAINMDKGVLSRGSRGLVISSQNETQRFDLDIPDNVFQMNLENNGKERICAIRDFENEWAHFTYRNDNSPWIFPTETLQYNYRDQSWAQFNESYTTYGQFTLSDSYVWSNLPYANWTEWNDPWNAGSGDTGQPMVAGGNSQGYVVLKDIGTSEATSLMITAITGNLITSPNHCLNNNDYIIITGALGPNAQQINNQVYQVGNVALNTFTLDPAINVNDYAGSGQIIRLYIPFIQTKQFPVDWESARKTRLGVQQYLMTYTDQGQVTLLIYLSQNSSFAYNDSSIVPDPGSTNNSLVYSTILYTCPESTNLGLSPANINLQMVTAGQQSQIWHRINTSLLGDTVQLGFTLSDSQMRSVKATGASFAITGATAVNPCVLTCNGNFPANSLVQIVGISGMTQLNNLIWSVQSSTTSTVTLNCNAATFTPYISGGTATQVDYTNQIAEIELHGIILDVSPSMVLA